MNVLKKKALMCLCTKILLSILSKFIALEPVMGVVGLCQV